MVGTGIYSSVISLFTLQFPANYSCSNLLQLHIPIYQLFCGPTGPYICEWFFFFFLSFEFTMLCRHGYLQLHVAERLKLTWLGMYKHMRLVRSVLKRFFCITQLVHDCTLLLEDKNRSTQVRLISAIWCS